MIKKEIVFVIDSLQDGGAERVISVLSNELIKRGWKVHIILLENIHKDRANYKVSPEVEIIELPIHQKFFKSYKVRILFWAMDIRKILRHIKPDVVIPFLAHEVIITWLATRFMGGVKIITSERGDPRKRKSRSTHCALFLYNYYVDALVMQTKEAKSFLSAKAQKKSVVIPNPITLKISAANENSRRIVTAGRLALQKNHELLINSFYDVHKLHPNYRLDIYDRGGGGG